MLLTKLPTLVKNSLKGDYDIETLRRWADQGKSVGQVSKEDVGAYLCFKKRIEKMEDEEFLQCLCNTGLKYEEKNF